MWDCWWALARVCVWIRIGFFHFLWPSSLLLLLLSFVYMLKWKWLQFHLRRTARCRTLSLLPWDSRKINDICKSCTRKMMTWRRWAECERIRCREKERRERVREREWATDFASLCFLYCIFRFVLLEEVDVWEANIAEDREKMTFCLIEKVKFNFSFFFHSQNAIHFRPHASNGNGSRWRWRLNAHSGYYSNVAFAASIEPFPKIQSIRESMDTARTSFIRLFDTRICHVRNELLIFAKIIINAPTECKAKFIHGQGTSLNWRDARQFIILEANHHTCIRFPMFGSLGLFHSPHLNRLTRLNYC